MLLLEVFAQVMVPILVVVGSGYLLRLTVDMDLRPLSRVSLYLLSPALIFSSLVEAEIAEGQTLRIVAFSVLLVGIMAVLALVAGCGFRCSSGAKTGLMLSM